MDNFFHNFAVHHQSRRTSYYYKVGYKNSHINNMKKKLSLILASVFMVLMPDPSHANGVTGTRAYGDYPILGVPFSDVTFTDDFWYPRLLQNQLTTIPIALDQCYTTGRVDNFIKAARIMQGDYSLGYFSTQYTFDDTDIYKILEGMSYSYKMMPSLSIKEKMDTLVKIVAAAQEPDGYLMTARTAGQSGNLHAWLGAQRWEKDPDQSHELYNSGHLFEAAAANYQATGDTLLLHVAKRNADLLVEKFLKGGLAYEPGHQIVEMGLVKLYRVTGNEDYLKLAKYFLDIRGINGPGSIHYEYNQSHMPPATQREAVGHAVRATYMYSGMADVAAIMDATAYQAAIDTIWDNVVGKKYYITGGIGALHGGEAFGSNYELPNLTAYNETCAAISNVYWNWRMFLTHGDSKYYDVIERTLYNGVLSGISLSGDHFFYPNPLESTGGYSRSAWFGCACCPSNLCRFIPSIPGYVYAHKDDSVYVNLFVQSEATVSLDNGKQMKIAQTTGYPWDGKVKINIEETTAGQATIKIRIPGWAKNHPAPSDLYSYLDQNDDSVRLYLNGAQTDYQEEKGYMVVSRKWKAGDELSFEFPMNVRRVVASDKVNDDKGKVALERGPIVYCLEGPDNDEEVQSSIVSDTASVAARKDTTTFAALPNHDMMVLDINGEEKNYSSEGTVTVTPKKLKAIPYYAWANRGAEKMEVWMARTEDAAETSINVVSHTDTLKVNVGEVPSSVSIGAYPSVPVKVDIAAVSKSFGITTSEVKSLYGSEITYAAIEPDGTVNTNSTANSPGHWFESDGTVTNWASTGGTCVIFSEFNQSSFVFNVGQYPGKWKTGDTFVIRQALTYVPSAKAPRRVVFEFHVKATDAQGVYNIILDEAKRLLNDENYSNVKGDAATNLRNAILADASSDYSSATSNLYSTVNAFVDAKVSADISDPAAGISSAVTAASSSSSKIYDLSGRCVGKGEDLRRLPAGIYICNGKKIAK